MATVFKPNANYARTFQTPGGMVGRWLKYQGGRVAVVSKTHVSKGGSGKLARSIKAGKVTKLSPFLLQIDVSATAKRKGMSYSYALVHHQGAKPHAILAKPGSALHWGGARGPTVVSVMHPGSKGSKYLVKGLKALNIIGARGTA